MTEAETILWAKVRRKFLKHRILRQRPLGPYIADFICREMMLVIELDGATHSTPEERAYDARRTRYMESRGWRVIRFSNAEVKGNLNGVVETIANALWDQQGLLARAPQSP